MPFSPVDDRFTTPMTLDSVNATIKGVLVRDSAKNVENPDIYDTVYKYKSVLNPDSIYTFRLKVQWVFDSKTSRMYSRIIGIAPIYSEIVNKELSKRTLFWVSYKDLRPSLVKNQVYNPKNMTNRITWDQLFESRYFNSYVVKSTMDNYNDKLLKALYKDPIKRLQEGEKIKQKIFDFEQDRWVY
jgi:gliding motility associated protien GldN